MARRPAQCLGMALLAPVVDPAHERRTVPERCVLVEDHDLLASIAPADAVTYAEMAVLQSRENWLRFQRAALPGITAADDDAMRRIGDLYELPHSNEDRLVLDRPVLVVAGKRDHIVGYEDQDALSRRFPRSTYAALDGAGLGTPAFPVYANVDASPVRDGATARSLLLPRRRTRKKIMS